MVRWVVCGFASVLACTVPNPQFLVDGEKPSEAGTSSTTADTAGPATTATTATTGAANDDTTTGESSGALTPDTTGSETTSDEPPSTTTGTTTTSTTTGTATDDTSTGAPGPCMDICGTPGCGECPPGPMVDYPNFAIDSRETSNSEYQQFLAAEQDPAMQPPACAWNDDFTPAIWPADGKALPVVGIDWCDARAYCAWAGKRLCGAIDGGPAKISQFTDPFANQWYRACSNGEGRNYPYGYFYNKLACNGADALFGGLIDVGSLVDCEAPVAGIFDLSGNVWEWVDTCIGEGPDAECVRRGGSYFSDADELRCDLFSKRPRANAVNHVGVRCCSL